MLNPVSSDTEVENWFTRYGNGTENIPERIFLPIAPWIPIIGLPANDR